MLTLNIISESPCQWALRTSGIGCVCYPWTGWRPHLKPIDDAMQGLTPFSNEGGGS